jgi:hypothetical protein
MPTFLRNEVLASPASGPTVPGPDESGPLSLVKSRWCCRDLRRFVDGGKAA